MRAWWWLGLAACGGGAPVAEPPEPEASEPVAAQGAAPSDGVEEPAPAPVEPVEPFDVGWVKFWLEGGARGRAEAALGELVARDPDDLDLWAQAPRLAALTTSTQWMRTALWQARLDRNEDDRLARYMVVAHQMARGLLMSDDCREAPGLLEPLVDDPDFAWHVYRLRQAKTYGCSDPFFEVDDDDLVDLVGERADLERALAALNTDDGEPHLGRLREIAAAEPEALEGLAERWLWRKGEALERALDDQEGAGAPVAPQDTDGAEGADPAWWDEAADSLRSIAVELSRSAHPWERLIAARVLACDADPRAARGIDALHEAHPELADPLTARCHELLVNSANSQPFHDAAYETLKAIDDRIPAVGDARWRWRQLVVSRLKQMKRQDRVAGLLSKWALSPGATPQEVSAWAYHLADHSRDPSALRQAVERLDALLEELLRGDGLRHPGNGKGDSLYLRYGVLGVSDGRFGVDLLLDTRGWLHFRLGDHEAALADLRQAQSYLADRERTAAHLGLVLLEMGREAEAVPWLLEASRGRRWLGSEALADQVLEALRSLADRAPVPFPGGLSAWLDAGELVRAPVESEPHERLGQPAPIDAVTTLDGEEVRWQDHRLTVVDLWATWCGPCVRGMPELDEVASTWADRGVRVVGLSVDPEVAQVERFFRRSRKPHYALAHLGQEGMTTFGVSSIPATFLVDAQGQIVHHHTGFDASSDRLERAILAHLPEEEREASPKDDG